MSLRAAAAHRQWSDTAPSLPGPYLFRCSETDYKPETVEVAGLPGRLLVHFPHLGWFGLDDYHAGLTDPQWRAA